MVLAHPLISWGLDHTEWELAETLTWGLAVAFVFVLSQLALLSIPVKLSEGKAVPQRSIIFSCIVCGIFMGWMIWLMILDFIVAAEIEFDIDDSQFLRVLLFGGWLFWAILFFLFYRKSGTEGFFKRTISTLLAGSTLQLLIAIPSHVIVKNRGDCCAPLFTFWGIATGLAVMLFAFGPGVLWLYAERIKRKRAENK
jgi:ABC-type thiamin/hydroxymethylpyrimidine transport system permease subunit